MEHFVCLVLLSACGISPGVWSLGNNEHSQNKHPIYSESELKKLGQAHVTKVMTEIMDKYRNQIDCKECATDSDHSRTLQLLFGMLNKDGSVNCTQVLEAKKQANGFIKFLTKMGIGMQLHSYDLDHGCNITDSDMTDVDGTEWQSSSLLNHPFISQIVDSIHSGQGITAKIVNMTKFFND